MYYYIVSNSQMHKSHPSTSRQFNLNFKQFTTETDPAVNTNFEKVNFTLIAISILRMRKYQFNFRFD